MQPQHMECRESSSEATSVGQPPYEHPSTSTGPKALHAAANVLDRWRRNLTGQQLRVALPDAHDPRGVEAAVRLGEDDAVVPVLVGEPSEVVAAARRAGRRLGEEIEIVDPTVAARDPEYVDALAEVLGKRSPGSRGALAAQVADPVYLTALMLRLEHADAAVAGATRPTADVVRAGLRVIGLAEGARVLSSCFVMVLNTGQPVGYGDCAVLPSPDIQELAEVAISSAATYTVLTGEAPVIAMLSFSTKGSAAHHSADRIRRAVEVVRERRPDLVIDGELQFDAAYVPHVGRSKAPGSRVAGRANVFVFPNLQAANIAYKITERIGGAVALGPILQGLAAPLNDLSRGCSADDIANTALLSAVQAVSRRKATIP